MSGLEMRPVWFGDSARPLFGWIHLPAGGTAKGAAILCPPLTREYASAHFTLRCLAEELARRGVLAVRFDYDGTGDSAGHDDDAARPAAWHHSIIEAVALARRTGAGPPVLVGMRMGALLAAHAARAVDDLAGLVLWDPCTSGRRFLREQRALGLVGRSFDGEGSDGIELPGFRLAAATVRDISELELPPLVGSVPRTLLLTRPGASHDRLLAGALEGCRVDRAEAFGQAEMMDVEPYRQTIPRETLSTVAGWIEGVLPEETRAVAIPAGLADRIRLPSPHAALRMSDGPAASATIEEEILALGPHGLFAIRTTSELTRAQPDVPPAVLLNSGSDSHIGPNRLWVELARSWAELGIPTVRVDLSGLGDSPVRDGQTGNVIRSPHAFDDVLDIATDLSPADPSNVIVAGLCSGAYQALETGLVLRPRAVLAVNPVFHFAPPEAGEGRVDRRRRFCVPTSALARAYRQLPFPRLRRLARAPMWSASRLLNRKRPSPARSLAELGRLGVECFCLGGRDELRPLLLSKSDDAGGTSGGRVVIEVIDGLDHALLRHRDQRLASARLTGFLLERLGGAGAQPPKLLAKARVASGSTEADGSGLLP